MVSQESSSTAGTMNEPNHAATNPLAADLSREESTVASAGIDSEVGKQLQFEHQAKLLDAIDQLRDLGLSKYVGLPSIIVCGDQSAGKSSVLEAISHVRFPTRSSVCTTFATELIIRRTSEASQSARLVSIEPDESRDVAAKEKLRNFSEAYNSIEDIPRLIEKAKAAIRNCSGLTAQSDISFSADKLKIQVCNPNWPPLTMIDVPGLINSENLGQQESDIALAQHMVRSYMKEKRTIILAIVTAKNDIANQSIFRYIKEVDPLGLRTIGVITKPDTLPVDSSHHQLQDYRKLVQNATEKRLKLGWHVVRNRSETEAAFTVEERDASEKAFFANSAWAEAAGDGGVGIDALRTRLSRVLHQHIVSSLPDIIRETDQKLKDTSDRLRKLGEPRSTAKEEQIYLTGIAEEFQRLSQSACDGTYSNKAFFDNPPRRKLRAEVQELTDNFAELMRNYGHKWSIRTLFPSQMHDASNDCLSTNPSLEGPIEITEEDYLERIKEIACQARGQELAGNFNHRAIWEVFRDLASRWTSHAESHVRRVWSTLVFFVEEAFQSLADGTTFNALKFGLIEDVLQARLTKALEKLDEISLPYTRMHPITYNPLLLTRRNDLRLQREERTADDDDSEGDLTSPSANINNEDPYACVDILDWVRAYYTIARCTFVDNVATLVVENCLLNDLVGIFSPRQVLSWDDDMLHCYASESQETQAQRETLQSQVKCLHDGLKISKDHLRYVDYSDAPVKAQAASTNSERDSTNQRDFGFLATETTPSGGRNTAVSTSRQGSRSNNSPGGKGQMPAQEKGRSLFSGSVLPHSNAPTSVSSSLFGNSSSTSQKKASSPRPAFGSSSLLASSSFASQKSPWFGTSPGSLGQTQATQNASSSTASGFFSQSEQNASSSSTPSAGGQSGLKHNANPHSNFFG